MFGEIRNAQGEKLDYTVHPGREGSHEIVVLGHGVTGNKDRPFVVALGEGLAAAGLTALRFSFAGNGGSEGRFQDCTISKEVDDLGKVLDAVGDRPIAYVGHSMGGAVGVLRTCQDPRIQFLVSLAGMVDTRGFYDREFGSEIPDQGCMWEEESCPLSRVYQDDMYRIGSVLQRGAEVDRPWLLVHGTEDDVVPPSDSHEIFAQAKEPKELFVIEGANHVFTDHTPAMVEKVVGWLKNQFQG